MGLDIKKTQSDNKTNKESKDIKKKTDKKFKVSNGLKEENKKEKNKKKNKKTTKEKILESVYMDKIPESVQDSIPIKAIYPEYGIIETKPGFFTKMYKVKDINFKLANEEVSYAILDSYMRFLNAFSNKYYFQIFIYNKSVDKEKTYRGLMNQHYNDGLDSLRLEQNSIIGKQISNTNNNKIIPDIYLVIGFYKDNIEEAIYDFNTIQQEIIDKNLKKIFMASGIDNRQIQDLDCTIEERLNLLRSLYRIFDGEENKITREQIESSYKRGIDFKDLIGPSAFRINNKDIEVGDFCLTRTFFLNTTPEKIKTTFIEDLEKIESNLIISMTFHPYSVDEQQKIVDKRFREVKSKRAMILEKKRNDGDFSNEAPAYIEDELDAVEELREDTKSGKERFFRIIFLVTVFAETREDLNQITEKVLLAGTRNDCSFRIGTFQQEQTFNTSLPLSRVDCNLDNLYRSSSACAFIPFTTQELMGNKGIYYGTNSESQRPILYDRINGGQNSNGVIIGASRSGKSVSAKSEIAGVRFRYPTHDVCIIDPQAEYKPLAKNLDGEVISLYSQGGSNLPHLNPLDLVLTEEADFDITEERSPSIGNKFNEILNLVTLMYNSTSATDTGFELDPTEVNALSDAVETVYKPYRRMLIQQHKQQDTSITPVLKDLYYALLNLGTEAGRNVAEIIKIYATGTTDLFAYKTNIDVKKHLIIYDISNVGKQLMSLAMTVCLNDVKNRMMRNKKKNNGTFTWIYIDEFHLPLQSRASRIILSDLWRTCQKFNGIATAITQSVKEFRIDQYSQAIIDQSFFSIIHNCGKFKDDIQLLFELSDQQVDYIDNNEQGTGIIKTIDGVIPFRNIYPKDSKLIEIFSTTDSSIR